MTIISLFTINRPQRIWETTTREKKIMDFIATNEMKRNEKNINKLEENSIYATRVHINVLTYARYTEIVKINIKYIM